MRMKPLHEFALITDVRKARHCATSVIIDEAEFVNIRVSSTPFHGEFFIRLYGHYILAGAFTVLSF